ncbi:LTA synthase family protein [Heliorestis acidaminivorans]|uniref:LTA synthase family protein n=1 Tax=Heliorestis acidaminivorans TaxID=553427 RepID=A0A6I0F3P4_9FIRM|nr:LTA synthase family protein [Heliorestis acidaminivorans]KAB2953347.1 LTA synthase family protein [Heliorestis acidaminivorans]
MMKNIFAPNRSLWAIPIMFLLWLLLPFLLLLAVEFIHRGSIGELFSWLTSSRQIILLNYLIALSFSTLVIAIVGSFYLSLSLATLLLLLFALINLYKLQFLGDPFFPWDLLFYQQVIKLFPVLAKETGFSDLLLIGLVVLAIFLLRKFLPAAKVNLWFRITGAVLSILLIYSIAFYKSSPNIESMIREDMKIHEHVWMQSLNYEINGSLLAFVMNIESAVVTSPSGYHSQAIETIATDLEEKVASAKNRTVAPVAWPEAWPKKKPNIIVIMNEAFWDPTRLENVSFSADPMPFFRSLQEHYSTGTLLSPVFGGNTSNVEFEVLTGFSMNYLPPGSVPYQQHIKRSTPSMASLLKAEGYHTIGVHPYSRWFWNREEVYGHLGFDHFYSIEAFEGSYYRGPYVADEEVSRFIIEQTESHEEPVFVYAVTMQNHGPYEANRYEENEVKVSGDLAPASIASLETFTQGVVDVDRSLQLLVEHYEQSPEPTLILLFGDHLPFLGANHSIYREAGFIERQEKDWSLEEYARMREVPFLLWSNYEQERFTLQGLSTSFLPPYIFRMANIELPLYYYFLDNFQAHFPGYIASLVIDHESNLLSQVPEELQHLEEQFWLLQYDLMFGRQYGLEFLRMPVATGSDG